MKKYTLFTLVLLLGLQLQAQQKWSLRKCIDYAIYNNIDIRQQELVVKNAEIDLSTSKSSRLPNLNGSLGYSFSHEDLLNVKTTATEDSRTSFTGVSIGSSTPIFTGFRIKNKIKSDELSLLASNEGLKKGKEILELQVTQLFLDVLLQRELLSIYKEQVEHSEVQVKRTQILIDEGRLPISQLYDMKAQLAKDELGVIVANNTLALAILYLSQALNLTDGVNFDIVVPSSLDDVVGSNASSIMPPSQIYHDAVSIKPHVKEMEFRLEGSKKDLKVAEAAYWPTLELNLSYETGHRYLYGRDSRDRYYENDSFVKQFSNNAKEVIGVTLNVPIFNRFEIRNTVKKAKINISSKEYDLQNMKLNLYKEIQQAYQNAIGAQAKFYSTEKAVEASEEAYRYAEDRYVVGKLTAFEYNDSKLKLLYSQSEQLQSKFDFLFRAKILDFYRGIPINIE